MNLPINRGGQIGDEYAHGVDANYYKIGSVNVIGRNDGLTRTGVIVIYELAD